jgi:hypothetical protein
MNPELEALILAYEELSASRDRETELCAQRFESLIDAVLLRCPNLSRDDLRKSVIKAHRKWALQQDKKPPAVPPKA